MPEILFYLLMWCVVGGCLFSLYCIAIMADITDPSFEFFLFTIIISGPIVWIGVYIIERRISFEDDSPYRIKDDFRK